MTLKILIADDAHDVADVIAFGARMNWPDCQVNITTSGADTLRQFEQDPADLVVLDVEMPPPDGYEVCRRIRAVSSVPILMLTVHDTPADKVRALDLGADDYLTKPFDHIELLARMRALIRRSNTLSSPRHAAPGTAAQRFTAGDFTLDFQLREVRIGGQRIPLTSTEYRVLETLVRNAGTVVPHRTLLEQVWGPEYANDTHYLKVFVRRLRRKLDDDGERPRYIQTEWGIGYRFIAPI